jgi:hypothetical protein
MPLIAAVLVGLAIPLTATALGADAPSSTAPSPRLGVDYTCVPPPPDLATPPPPPLGPPGTGVLPTTSTLPPLSPAGQLPQSVAPPYEGPPPGVAPEGLPGPAQPETQPSVRRASTAECAAWQARSNRLTVRLNALGRAKFHGRRAYAASRLTGKLSSELSGYRGLLVVGCLPLPPIPAQPAGSGPVLSTIPATLLEHLTFTAAQGAPAISQAQAEQIAGRGVVRGSQLAHCSYSPLVPGEPLPTLPPPPGTTGPPQPAGVYTFDHDCWIVSLPGGDISSGPPGAPRSVSVYHVTLLDAQTGAFPMGAEG